MSRSSPRSISAARCIPRRSRMAGSCSAVTKATDCATSACGASGRIWEPVVSAFHSGQAFHFMTQISNGDIVVVDYYNLNNNGFGALFRLPAHAPSGQPQFYSAFGTGAPGLDQTVGAGYHYPFTIPFQPRGM